MGRLLLSRPFSFLTFDAFRGAFHRAFRPAIVAAVALAALAAMLTGCKGKTNSGGDSPAPTVRGLALSAGEIWFSKAGETRALDVFAVFDDDSRQPATNISWATDDAGVATVNAGLVTATGVGETTITASVGNLSRNTTVIVGPDWFAMEGFSGGGTKQSLAALAAADLAGTTTNLEFGGSTFLGGVPFAEFFDGYLYLTENHGPAELAENFAAYADGYLVADANNTRWAAFADGAAADALVSGQKLRVDGANLTDIHAPLASAPINTGMAVNLYVRFTLNVTTPPTAAGCFAAFNAASPVGRIFIEPGVAAGTFRVGIANGAAVPGASWAADLATGTDHTIIVKFDVDNAVTTLWVNPANEADTNVSDGANGVAAAIADLAIFQDAAFSPAVFSVDDWRIAKDFGTARDAAYDRISKVDPATWNVVAEMPLHDDILGVASAASAQDIAFYSAHRAYVAHLAPDGAGDYYVTVFDPTTMQISGKITLPNPTGNPLYCEAIAVFHNFVFVGNAALDVNALTYSAATVAVIDGETNAVVDADTGTAGTQFIAVPGVSLRRMIVSPSGKLYAIASGNASGFVSPQDTAKLTVIDPLSFATATLDFGTDGYGGSQVALSPTGRLYIGSQNFGAPDLLTVDGVTDQIVRNGANRLQLSIAGTPLASGYWLGMNITPEGRVLLGNQGNNKYYAFDAASDTGAGTVAATEVSTANPPGVTALWRPARQMVFVDEVVAYVNPPAAGANDSAKALGAPMGGGSAVASTDVAEIGAGGHLAVKFSTYRIVDGPGADFVVFSTATYTQAAGDARHLTRNIVPGIVEVSADGKIWHPFPTSTNGALPATHPGHYTGGWFGIQPTWTTPANGIHPASWTAGGDRFDLAAVGLAHAKYIRLAGDGARVDAVGALHFEQD